MIQIIDRLSAVLASIATVILPWLVDHGIVDATTAGIIGSTIGAAVTAWHGGSYIQSKVGNTNNTSEGQ